MRYYFYLAAGLGLVLIQSAILPYFSVFDKCCDMLIPFVLYLSVFCPFVESSVVIVCFGLLMDSMSGGIFGLYTTSYVWIFIGIKWLMAVVNIANSFLLGLLSAVGIVLQDVIVLGVFGFLGNSGDFPEDAFFILSVRLIWAVATGGFVVAGLRYFHKLCDDRSWRFAEKFAK